MSAISTLLLLQAHEFNRTYGPIKAGTPRLFDYAPILPICIHSLMTNDLKYAAQRVSCKKKWKWMKWPAAGGVLLAVASAGTGAGAGAWPLLAALFAACRPPGRSDDASTPPGKEATPGCSRGRIGKARGERKVRHCVLAGGVRSQHTSTSTGCKRVADLRSPKCKQMQPLSTLAREQTRQHARVIRYST